MTRLTLEISMSLDGFVAGPNPTRLFDHLERVTPDFMATSVFDGRGVTHLTYRIMSSDGVRGE